MLLLIVVGVLYPAGTLCAQTTRDAVTVLAQMRKASGGAAWNPAAEIVQRGSMKENGFTGRVVLGADLKTGEYAFKALFSAARATIGQGVKGNEAWSLNQQGDLAVRSGAETDAGAVTDMYLYRHAYWNPGFDGAVVTAEPPASQDGASFDRIRITPVRGETVVLWINAATYLLDREQRGGTTLQYSDYREVRGLKLPFEFRHLNKNHEDWAIQVDSIDVKTSLDASDLAIPFYHDFDMPPSRVASVPTERGTTFEAMINGKGPFKMFFDTGSINIISQDAAKALGVVPLGHTAKLGAADGGSVGVRPTTVRTIRIGDVTLHDQPFVIMNLPTMPGEPIAVLGYEFLQRLVVKIDYEHNRMTMYDPAQFVFSGKGVAVPMLVNQRTLSANGSVDGFKGLFALDTGNDVALELEPNFVRANDLLDRTRARFHGYAGRGYAGPLPDSYYARIRKLKIGDAEVDEIAANLAQGNPHPDEPDGNLGRSVLDQFNSTFDLSRSMLYLEKNANWGPVPFNRAGIVVDPQDDGMQVMTVLAGSPGEAAGLQVGDVITEIDGKKLEDAQDQSAFTRPVGTVLRLTLERGKSTRDITVVLKDVL